LETLCAAGENISRLTQAILLHQRLHATGLYLTRFEALFDTEARPLPNAPSLLKALTSATGPVFMAYESETPWRELLPGQRTICIHFGDPDYAMRLQLWETALRPVKASVERADLEALADRFRLTPSQIAAAVAAAVDAQALSNPRVVPSI